MAELNRAVAALRVVGDDLSPDEVTALLGASPTRSFVRGDEVRHKRAPARIARFGLWSLDAPETEPADLDAQVSELLRPLTADLGVWRDLAERFTVDLFCGWFMKVGNEGLTIAPSTLGALAERHIELDLDIYSGDGELAPDRHRPDMPPSARGSGAGPAVSTLSRHVADRRAMTSVSVTQVLPPASVDPLRLAAAAYLARFKGQSRVHTESDLRAYLLWCAERGLDPLAATRPHIELYVRWMQEQRRYAASTVSRRLAVVAGFYRTCVIDGVLEHSPAENVRRPTVSPQSPTLGLSHLQFEAMLAAARDSTNPCDFALVCLLGLLGLRIFEATSLDIADLGEEHGHRVLRVVCKGHKVVLVPMPPAVARAVDRAIGHRATGPILLNQRGTRMDRHAATRRLRRLQAVAGVQITRMHPHMLRHTFVTTMLDAGVDLRDTQIAARHADPRTTMRYDRARTNLDRHPNYILAAYMSSGT
jgi:integrase/recombinase XerD